jgi:hypothetical protein
VILEAAARTRAYLDAPWGGAGVTAPGSRRAARKEICRQGARLSRLNAARVTFPAGLSDDLRHPHLPDRGRALTEQSILGQFGERLDLTLLGSVPAARIARRVGTPCLLICWPERPGRHRPIEAEARRRFRARTVHRARRRPAQIPGSCERWQKVCWRASTKAVAALALAWHRPVMSSFRLGRLSHSRLGLRRRHEGDRSRLVDASGHVRVALPGPDPLRRSESRLGQ